MGYSVTERLPRFPRWLHSGPNNEAQYLADPFTSPETLDRFIAFEVLYISLVAGGGVTGIAIISTLLLRKAVTKHKTRRRV